MMSNLFLHCQHTIRFAATRKEVAVSKCEAKSAGVHAERIVFQPICEVKEVKEINGAIAYKITWVANGTFHEQTC
jgi:hypothetical protein